MSSDLRRKGWKVFILFSGLFAGRLLLGVGTAAVLMGSLKAYTRWFPGSMFATLTGLQITLGNCGNLLATAPMAWAANTYGWRYSCTRGLATPAPA